eukprot:ANDGO_08345.mRNA.1 Flagellar radial spoke protein 4
MSTVSPSAVFMDAKSYLKTLDENGLSLYEHLVELVAQAAAKNVTPANLAAKSFEVRTQSHRASVSKQPTNAHVPTASQVYESTSARELFRNFGPSFSSSSSLISPQIPNLTHQQSQLAAAGFAGLTEMEAVLLHAVTCSFAETFNVEMVRFFGKILGTRGVYYVIESSHWQSTPVSAFSSPAFDVKDKKGRPIPAESAIGSNGYTYWVARSASTAVKDWIALPDVTPSQIVLARKIKKVFTGDLDHTIQSYPPFPGQEREYLRAQIARIAAGAVIAPKGVFAPKPVPEDEDEDAAKNKPAPTGPSIIPSPTDVEAVEALDDLSSWTHVHPMLLKLGRVKNVPKPAPKEGEEEAAEEEEEQAKEEEKDALAGTIGGDDGDVAIGKVQANLMSTEEEEGSSFAIPAWTVRSVNTKLSHSKIVLVKSLRWPGMVAYGAAGGLDYSCVYVGNGLKNESFTFMPMPTMVDDAAPIPQSIEFETELTYGEPAEETQAEAAE